MKPANELRAALEGAALWVAGIGWLVPMMGTLMGLQTLVGPDRVDWLSRIYTRGQVRLTGSRWRAVVDPAVRPDRPYVFVQNHTNHFDHVAMYAATPHFKQGIELEDHFRYPVYGWFMRQRGTIAVRRGDAGQVERLADGMRREAALGRSILAFPEGTRTRDGRVGEFKTGVFFAARAAGLAVVPVAVTGMYDVMRKGDWRIRAGHEVTVHVLAPREANGLSDDGVRELARASRDAIARYVDAYLDSPSRGANA